MSVVSTQHHLLYTEFSDIEMCLVSSDMFCCSVKHSSMLYCSHHDAGSQQQQPFVPPQSYPPAPPGSYPPAPPGSYPQHSYPPPATGSYPTQQPTNLQALPPDYSAGTFSVKSY